MKKRLTIIFLVITVLSLPIASYLVFDINEMSIPAASLFLISYGLFFCLFLLTGLFLIPQKSRIAILLLLAVVAFCTFFLPQTELGIELNFTCLRSAREETVMMYQSDTLSQSGPYEYIPNSRIESQTGRVYITDSGKIEFTLYHCFKKSVKLIYTPDDEGVNGTEYFSDSSNKYPRSYTDIKKLDINWYVATVVTE
ncbi:MAG: hypothetical protein IJ002_03770 [Clostridia bacterium]|nr:hypothetical protein [Clostridia bacterium]